LALLVASAALAAAVGAQDAASVPLVDPVYRDLGRLDAFGLLPQGLPEHLPYGVARVRHLVDGARRELAAHRLAFSDVALQDLDALLERLEERFQAEAQGRPAAWVEGELGGGRSAGRPIPHNGVGQVDATINPLWAYRHGRAYGDRFTVASSAGLSVPLGRRWAVTLGGRATALWASGSPAGKRDAVLENASVRVLFGPVAVQVGRGGEVWGGPEGRGLLLSRNGPALNMLRVSTDRSLDLGFLGGAEFSLLAADLGPNQNFPHAKLFGFRADVWPWQTVGFGLSVLNKQLGEGAPEATVGERIRDLTVLWGLVFGDDIDRFSEKLVSLDIRVRVPEARGLQLRAGMVLTDFDKDRVGDVLDAGAAYHVSVEVPRLGTGGRHSFALDAVRIGPLVYRHHQFRSGLTVDGLLQGSALGPDARSLGLRYGYRPLGEAWEMEASAVWETRRADIYDRRFEPEPDVYKTVDRPDESRVGTAVQFARGLWEGRLWVKVGLGLERVIGFAFEEGAARTGERVLLNARHLF
jgi:hypothetical protein